MIPILDHGVAVEEAPVPACLVRLRALRAYHQGPESSELPNDPIIGVTTSDDGGVW